MHSLLLPNYVPCHGQRSLDDLRRIIVPDGVPFRRALRPTLSDLTGFKCDRRTAIKIGGTALFGTSQLLASQRSASAIEPATALFFYGVSVVGGAVAAEATKAFVESAQSAMKAFAKEVFFPELKNFLNSTVRAFYGQIDERFATRIESILKTVDGILVTILDILKGVKSFFSYLFGEPAPPKAPSDQVLSFERRDRNVVTEDWNLPAGKGKSWQGTSFELAGRSKPYDINTVEQRGMNRYWTGTGGTDANPSGGALLLPNSPRTLKGFDTFEDEIKLLSKVWGDKFRNGDDPIKLRDIRHISTAVDQEGEQFALITLDRADPDTAKPAKKEYQVIETTVPVPIIRRQ
jgi:hypothetical protein